MRSLILEGCDCTGKSTLAQQLIQRHQLKYVHAVPAFDTSAEEVFSFYSGVMFYAVQGDLFDPKMATLLDRCYLSEAVYGPIKRSFNRLAGRRFNLLRQLQHEYNIRQVICMPPWSYVLDTWRAKKEDYLKTEDELQRVYDAYQIYAESNGVETYDYTTGKPFVFPRD